MSGGGSWVAPRRGANVFVVQGGNRASYFVTFPPFVLMFAKKSPYTENRASSSLPFDFEKNGSEEEGGGLELMISPDN